MLLITILRFDKKLYENEREIYSSLQETYPGAFDYYKEKFYQFNYENLCIQKFAYCKTIVVSFLVNFTMDIECENINNGLLKKGLRTTVISITMKC